MNGIRRAGSPQVYSLRPCYSVEGVFWVLMLCGVWQDFIFIDIKDFPFFFDLTKLRHLPVLKAHSILLVQACGAQTYAQINHLHRKWLSLVTKRHEAWPFSPRVMSWWSLPLLLRQFYLRIKLCLALSPVRPHPRAVVTCLGDFRLFSWTLVLSCPGGKVTWACGIGRWAILSLKGNRHFSIYKNLCFGLTSRVAFWRLQKDGLCLSKPLIRRVSRL